MKEAEEILKQGGLTRKFMLDKYPSSVFFVKGEKWMYEYDLNSTTLWCRWDEIWNKINSLIRSNHNGIQSFIKEQLGKQLKGVVVTPLPSGLITKSWLEKQLKGVVVTPLQFDASHLPELKKQLKETTPFATGSLCDLMPICVLKENNLAHALNTPAVIFSNGEHLFYYKGVHIAHELFYKLYENTITFEEFIKEKNEEVKSAILSYIEEKHGSEALYRFISKHLKEVNTYVDKKDEKYLIGTTGGMNIGVYTLFKGRISGVSISNKNGRGNEGHLDLAFVRCYCFSTDRMFFLGCDPAHNNAKDAIASLYRIPRKMKPHLKYINRQGERFSSTFTEEGKVLRNALSKEDFSDLVEISGDEYFSLMRYEY